MKNKPNKSEIKFKEYCVHHKIRCEKIPETNESTPDFLININGIDVYVEIKQIDENKGFLGDGSVNSRIVGKLVGNIIKNKSTKKQMKYASLRNSPAILLIYNNLDPLQLFGTEEHDFVHAMFGKYSVQINRETHECSQPFYGEDKSFRINKNINFSAVGRISDRNDVIEIHLWENPYAKNKLDFDDFPKCIKFTRVSIELI